MLRPYLPILIQFVIVALLGAVIIGLSAFVGRKPPTRAKLGPYECGSPPVGNARGRFSVSFYLVGMLFLLFDVETIFLYLWAVVYRSMAWFPFYEMLVFIFVIAVGYVYAWKKGALDWDR
jgi:NADH-quinone oxidoreductase subunit A